MALPLLVLGSAGLIVLGFYLSRWSHLETLNWLIRNMVGYLVFALIVLFQADIRRALAHVGRAADRPAPRRRDAAPPR